MEKELRFHKMRPFYGGKSKSPTNEAVCRTFCCALQDGLEPTTP